MRFKIAWGKKGDMKSIKLIAAALIMTAVSSVSIVAEDLDGSLRSKLSKFAHSQGKRAQFMVYDLKRDATVFAYQEDLLAKPASIQKILISAVALRELGAEYTFETEFFGDYASDSKSDLKTLYLHGSGDPSFTIESLWMSIRKLKRRGIRRVNQIILDGTLFEGERERVGQRAYESGSAALAFNFNSIAFDLCGTKPGQPGLVLPDPNEIGVAIEGKIMTSGKNSFALDELPIGNDGALRYRVSGSVTNKPQCRTIYRSVEDPEAVLAQTLRNLLEDNGISVDGGVKRGIVPKEADLIFIWESKPLASIIADLNHFSNNFTAEQLLFAVGRTPGGKLSREAGLKKLVTYAHKLNITSPDLVIDDASGLSHENRVPVELILNALVDIYSDDDIRPEIESAFPIAGKTGTLKDRPMGAPGSTVRAKTGSLTGVSALAGYAFGCKGSRYAFAILSNRVESREAGHKVEREFVNVLTSCN